MGFPVLQSNLHYWKCEKPQDQGHAGMWFSREKVLGDKLGSLIQQR